MRKIEPALEARLRQRPEQTVRLIVRVAGDVPQVAARLKELEVTVLRSFTLIPALAISCSAATALGLLQEAWVQAIEEDRQVSAQAPQSRSPQA
jgi:hypothetical protein